MNRVGNYIFEERRREQRRWDITLMWLAKHEHSTVSAEGEFLARFAKKRNGE